MPNSLRVKLSKLRYKGEITQEEYAELIKKLDKHDSELLDKVAEKLKAEMVENYPKNINGVKAPTPFAHFSYRGVCDILDKVIGQMKAEVSE